MLDNIRITLTNTTHPGNIGSAARAMKTMGVTDLRLVNPEDYPRADATAMASGAHDVLANAPVCSTLEEAIGECEVVFGTSARMRGIPMPVLDAREAAALALDAARTGPVAFLFGRERHGLTNDEMQRCRYLVNIPSNPAYSSLNLAASVQVITYELRMAELALTGEGVEGEERDPATFEQMEGFFDHLKTTLIDVGFLGHRKPVKLMQRLRRLFHRAEPDEREINILRGVLTAIQNKVDQPDGE